MRVNSHLTRLAHYPDLWTHISLASIPTQRNLQPLSAFLLKYTPAKSIRSLHYPSTVPPPEFLKFAITLKTLHSRLRSLHLQGKGVNNLVLAASETLLGKWTKEVIVEQPCDKLDIAQITSFIAAAPRLRVLSLSGKFAIRQKPYVEFVRAVMTAGAINRLYRRHPEINTRLRTLHLSSSTVQTVPFSHLASLGSFFPLLEFLRLENWRLTSVGETESLVAIKSLRGLALVSLDVEKKELYTVVLAKLIHAFPSLEILMLGTRESDLWGWKIFNRKRELGPSFFESVNLQKLKVLWLRRFTFDPVAFLRLHTPILQFAVLEECRGSNGGWVKACRNRWAGITVVESPVEIRDGVDFAEQIQRRQRIVRMAKMDTGIRAKRDGYHASH